MLMELRWSMAQLVGSGFLVTAGTALYLQTLIATALDPSDMPSVIERVGMTAFVLIALTLGGFYLLRFLTKNGQKVVAAHLAYLHKSARNYDRLEKSARMSARAARMSAKTAAEIKHLIQAQSVDLSKQTVAFEHVHTAIENSSRQTVKAVEGIASAAVKQIVASGRQS